MPRKSECIEKIIYRYSENLKRQIVEEIESGILSTREAQYHYGIKYRKTVTRWVAQYGKQRRTTKIVRVMMKDEQRRIQELEKALADERLRNRVYAAQLKQYAKEVPDLKKRLDTERLKKFEENEKRIQAMD